MDSASTTQSADGMDSTEYDKDKQLTSKLANNVNSLAVDTDTPVGKATQPPRSSNRKSIKPSVHELGHVSFYCHLSFIYCLFFLELCS